MARSRSSFDVDKAVATATSLASSTETKHKKGKKESAITPEVSPLVRFGSPPPEPEPSMSVAVYEEAPASEMPPSSAADTTSGPWLRSALPLSGDDVTSRRSAAIEGTPTTSVAARPAPSPPTLSAERASGGKTRDRRTLTSLEKAGDPRPAAPVDRASDRRSAVPLEKDGDRRALSSIDDAARELAGGRVLPRFPEIGALLGPFQRCEKVVEWIAEATGATDVFLADAAGLPFAGAIRDTETRLAASGLIASAVGSLAAALPGAPSQRFELHVGDEPSFQLIGFQASSAAYIVGLMRATPLTPRQANAVRIACRHALGEGLGGGR